MPLVPCLHCEKRYIYIYIQYNTYNTIEYMFPASVGTEEEPRAGGEHGAAGCRNESDQLSSLPDDPSVSC